MAAVCNVASVTGFLSTPSARRATSLDPLHMVLRLISIHALREEGDHITSTVKYTAAQISIHALREEGDARVLRYVGQQRIISIHALREEGDRGRSWRSSPW